MTAKCVSFAEPAVCTRPSAHRSHKAWLGRQRFVSPALQTTFDYDYDAVLTVSARRVRLDTEISAMAANVSSPRSCDGWAVCATSAT